MTRMDTARRSAIAKPSRRKMLTIGVPAVLAVSALTAVPFLVGSDEDSIRSTDSTTPAAPSTSSPPNDRSGRSDLFVDAVTTDSVAVAATPPPTAVDTTTTTTTSTVATTALETLPEQPPQPIAPPADPRAPEDQILLGGISIPKLGVDQPLWEGIRLSTLDNGPGHWPGTAMPGEVGNVVVAAHRTSHGGPFRNIDQLVAGDAVVFTTEAGGEIAYTVTGTQIVNPDAVWIVDPTDTPTATLFACHPPGSVAQRIVVNLELAA
jgi:sortase A